MPSRLILMAVVIGLSVAAPTAVAAPRDQALDRTLPEMKFTGVTFGDAIDFVRDVGGLNIHVNWKALEQEGVTADAPVNIRLRAVSLRKVLNLLLSEAGGSDRIAFYMEDGVVEVTTRALADKKVYTRVYPVDDLVMEMPEFIQPPSFNLQSSSNQGGSGGGGGGGGSGLFGGSSSNSNRDRDNVITREQRGEELVQLVTETLRPDIWAVNGGNATIRYFRGSLIVTAPRSVHEALGG